MSSKISLNLYAAPAFSGWELSVLFWETFMRRFGLRNSSELLSHSSLDCTYCVQLQSYPWRHLRADPWQVEIIGLHILMWSLHINLKVCLKSPQVPIRQVMKYTHVVSSFQNDWALRSIIASQYLRWCLLLWYSVLPSRGLNFPQSLWSQESINRLISELYLAVINVSIPKMTSHNVCVKAKQKEPSFPSIVDCWFY